MNHISYMAKTFTTIFLTLWIPAMVVIIIVGVIHSLITGNWRTWTNEEKAENK